MDFLRMLHVWYVYDEYLAWEKNTKKFESFPKFFAALTDVLNLHYFMLILCFFSLLLIDNFV